MHCRATLDREGLKYVASIEIFRTKFQYEIEIRDPLEGTELAGRTSGCLIRRGIDARVACLLSYCKILKTISVEPVLP